MAATVPPPRFLADLPEHPLVQELGREFARGHYAQLRDRARAAGPQEPDIQAAIDELVRRTTPAPLTKWLFGLSAFLLASATWFAYAH